MSLPATLILLLRRDAVTRQSAEPLSAQPLQPLFNGEPTLYINPRDDVSSLGSQATYRALRSATRCSIVFSVVVVVVTVVVVSGAVVVTVVLVLTVALVGAAVVVTSGAGAFVVDSESPHPCNIAQLIRTAPQAAPRIIMLKQCAR
jgi:hypothetical protein